MPEAAAGGAGRSDSFPAGSARSAFPRARRCDISPSGAKRGQDAVSNIFIDEAIIVENGFGRRCEMTVQEMHDVIGQILFALSREVADVGKKDGDLKLLSFSGGDAVQLVEVKDRDLLRIMKEPADNQLAVNPCLAGKANELVPSPLAGNHLFDGAPGREVRNPIQDLDSTGSAAPLAAALVEVRNPVPDRDVKQCLAIGSLDRNVMEIGDFMHGTEKLWY
jgi:hypothetical protein